MGQIKSDFYKRFQPADNMELPFTAEELVKRASLDAQREFAGKVVGVESGYIPKDVLLGLLRDETFFGEMLKIRDTGENVVLSGITLGYNSKHINNMGLTEEDVAANTIHFMNYEESMAFSINSAMAGTSERVSALYVFANGWFGIETERLADTIFADENGVPFEDGAQSVAVGEEVYEPSTSYLFSDEGDLVATPDIQYDVDQWMNFVDLFSAVQEEASAVDAQPVAFESEEGFGKQYIVYSEEVLHAMHEGRPVVVMETAATFGGMIYPGNAEFAMEMANKVREYNAVPAFTAILGGQIHIGMSDNDIRYLDTKRGSVFKASARDIPILIAKRADAVMTIAAVVQVAALVGLNIASGSGIGGAQIGAEKTMDISTDLQSLAKNPVMVVCSGTKPTLDLSLTMEYLETAGVPVIGYRTDRMPEYMLRGSSFRLTYRMETPQELAQVMAIKAKMGIPGGVLVVNPVPKEYELDPVKTKKAVDAAIEDVAKNNIRGKAITGYMMGRIRNYLGDQSAESQKAFLMNNAKVAAQIAAAMNRR